MPSGSEIAFASAEELVALYRAADIVVYPYRAITTSGALATGLALGQDGLPRDALRELFESFRTEELGPDGILGLGHEGRRGGWRPEVPEEQRGSQSRPRGRSASGR